MDPISRRTFLKGLGVGAAALSHPDFIGRALAQGRIDEPDQRELAAILDRALARGGHYADVFLETRTQTRIAVAGSEISSLEYGILQGGGVKTVFREKVGYAYAESFNPEALLEVADFSARIAAGSGGTCAPFVEVPFSKIISARQPLGDAFISDKLPLLERMDRAARAVSPLVKQVTIDWQDADQQFTVATSCGQLVHDRLPIIYVRVTVNAARGDQVAQGMRRLAGRTGLELFLGSVPEEVAREAAAQAVRMLAAQPAPSGEMPVVIAAGGGVMFHEAVGHGLEADAVLRNATVFAGRVGDQVASEHVTIYDDGTIPAKRGSFNIDDEGTPPGRTTMIERGILRGYMQDRRTAHNLGAQATGNGRRQSFRHPAIVRMTNTCLAPGEESADEIIASTQRGLYAVDFGGGEVDTASGQFTFGLREAYLIEDGRVTAPVTGANLVSSGPEVIQRIDRVASDFGYWPGTCGKAGQWVPVTSACPTLRVTGITVGGTA